MTRTSLDVRAGLVDALRLDLIGPSPGDAHERKLLADPPSRFYVTVSLVPHEAPTARRDDPAQGLLDLDLPGPADDDQPPESASACPRVPIDSG